MCVCVSLREGRREGRREGGKEGEREGGDRIRRKILIVMDKR